MLARLRHAGARPLDGIADADLAQEYAKNWQERLAHSVPYERRKGG
jgi:hypothetical protein